MTNDDQLDPNLHQALHLDGSAESIKTFYRDWAADYDADTAGFNYAAPAITLYLMQNLPAFGEVAVDPRDTSIRIMDAGCGTGQLARILSAAGYSRIDGFDISPDMAGIANSTGLYGACEGDVDINQPVREQWQRHYDLVVSIGVFTPGHVPPAALARLVDMTRHGGLIIVSTRTAYCESENYVAASEALEAEGRVQLLYSLMNAAYTDDEAAHYWVYCAP